MQLKKDYKLWLKMKDKSGWGWDDENQIPIVDDEQWEQWISAHSSMAPYRTQSFPYVQQLDYLIGKSTATGVFCSATQESIRKRNVPSEEVEEEKENARRTPETETIEVEAPAKRRKIAVTEEDSMRLLTSSPDVPPRRDSSISETPAAPPLNPTEDKLPSAKKPANDQQNSSKKSTGGHALGRGLSDIADSLREKHNSVKKTIVQQAIEILMQVKTEINLGSRDVLTISKQLKDEDEAAMFIGFDDSTRKYWLRDELGLPTDDDDKGQPDSDSTSGN
ncbi:hypothetical protein BKA69DRAFT_375374 [Paraphysoderma sedebokerense]|nr:hypothetical protein BKA69DRAFT_375374 [Paraphysoderma sedebokerense]